MTKIDSKHLEDFRELIKKEDYDAVEHWYDKINPKIVGMERVKKSILISLASSSDKFGDRGRVHVLLEGDPGTAKSEIRMWLSSKLGAETCSQRTTSVGLTGDARGDEITPGALPRADKGVITIDELDEFKPRDRKGLLESMSEGEVTIEAGGMKGTFSAECRVIGCTNTTDNFSPELLDRFDFHFQLETPDSKEEKEILSHITQNWFKEKDKYAGIKLKNYLKWIRGYEPKISGKVRMGLDKFIQMYIDLEDDGKGVRHKESIIRIGYTIAKLNRREVKLTDALEAVKLLNGDINSGKIEALKQFIDNYKKENQ